MSTADTIALSALEVAIVIGLGQTALLTWYAWETRKLRKDAAAQNVLIAGQLTTMQESLQLAISREEREADLNMLWFDGIRMSPNGRLINGLNIGGTIQVLELRYSAKYVSLDMKHNVIQSGSTVTLRQQAERNIRVYFGIRYITKQRQVKELVFEVEPDSLVPKLASLFPYNNMSVVETPSA